MKFFLLFCACLLNFEGYPQAPVQASSGGLLKYVVYDFDGLDIGQTDLPDGEYRNGDLSHAVAANPLAPSAVLGDRVLKLDMNWQGGAGEFGKATMRFIDLDWSADRLNCYIYNPASNSADASIILIITEDDNGNDVFEDSNDDKWVHNLGVSRSSAWQLISVPLSSFQDGNSGGNGSFDAGYSGNGGMLFSVGMVFQRPAGATFDQYFIDMLSFSEGSMPVGNSILDLPFSQSGTPCSVGALGGGNRPEQVPGEIESYLPDGKKLDLINWFLYYANSGTTPNVLPGQEVQQLIDNGYMPIITWEMMYASYARLDPVQPRLDKILDGSFDGYIDAFAARVKSYNGTVILRIFHEFEGDWYSWSLTHNGQDPGKYIAAFRHVVDRFRGAGANNVKWMWCLNAEPKPYVRYNSVRQCYPGDSYVDIVATDIYNHPDLGTPAWKSFRYTLSESYYYLVKYFSHKPIYICEVGCRERKAGENSGSQSKSEWICRMNSDLKSYFSKVQALVFFSMEKEHDWRINSSDAARQAFVDCIWNDAYYGGTPVLSGGTKAELAFNVYPNPFADELRLLAGGMADTSKNCLLRVFDMGGKTVFLWESRQPPTSISLGILPRGVYIFELRNGTSVKREKLVKLAN